MDIEKDLNDKLITDARFTQVVITFLLRRNKTIQKGLDQLLLQLLDYNQKQLELVNMTDKAYQIAKFVVQTKMAEIQMKIDTLRNDFHELSLIEKKEALFSIIVLQEQLEELL